MKRLDIVLDTGETEMPELRPILDAAITDHFDDGFLHHRWEGDVLQLSGPGAHGSIIHEAGHLKLQAELKPPASWVHKTIRRKIEAALGDLAAKIA